MLISTALLPPGGGGIRKEDGKNRILLSYLIDVTVTLAKQELAFRRHDEKDRRINLIYKT
jgi:hypothetical protein